MCTCYNCDNAEKGGNQKIVCLITGKIIYDPETTYENTKICVVYKKGKGHDI